jgi:tetratricopeptide (TPR) repeat protein
MRTGNSEFSNFKSQISNLKLAAIAACLTLTLPIRAHAAPPSEAQLGQQALAEEFASAAVKAVNRDQIKPTPPMVRQSASLLRAACDECNFEPRFPRLLSEACVQLNDVDGAIDALVRYRRIQEPAVQNDQFAQVQLIDLATSKQQSLEDKLDYLKPLLKVAALPDPVRSHIAWKCADLYAQKFDKASAQAMLTQALQLNPISPEALQSQEAAARATGIPQKEAAALVALLKSNPAQPLVMGSLADELASVGQPDAAVIWYKRSFQYSQELGVGLDPGRYLNYAAALYSMDQPRNADEAAGMLLAGQPSNIGAATIGLLAARVAVKPPVGGPAPADASVLQLARDKTLAALTAQMGTLHGMLHGVNGAVATQASTTQPADLIGDITTDTPQVRDLQNRASAGDKELKFAAGYTAALADLTFYYAYFDPQPANANKLLDCLRTLKPAGDLELTRLEGFTFLADGKQDEAKVKFSAVAAHDPLSRMGLILMEPAGDATSADAAKLVTDHPAGVLGAILLDALRDKGGKPLPTSDSSAVAAEAAAFPVRMLDLLDRSHTPEFYSLVAQPVHVAVGYDEPALVRVTIKNTGDYDLSLGADAAIRSDLWFDVLAQAGSNPFFPGVAFDHIAGPLVLKAHHVADPGSDQIIRVDTGPLVPFLTDRPTLAVSMLFSVLTNPIGQQSGVAPGPGGYRKQFSAPIERKASPIASPKLVQDLLNPVANGRIDQKIHSIELLTDYVLVLQGRIAGLQKQQSPAAEAAGGDQPAGNTGAGALPPPPGDAAASAGPDLKARQQEIQDMQGVIGVFSGTIRAALRDPSPIVRYWAQAKLALLTSPALRKETAAVMLQGKDWEQRMLGLMVANDLPPATGKSLAQSLANDPVSYVKDFAAATIELANTPPPKPTTAP